MLNTLPQPQTQRTQRTAQWLTYAGALPFVAAAMLGSEAATWLARTYAAVILAFLSGMHWAVYLLYAARCPRPLLLTSNAIALAAWIGLLATPVTGSLLLLALAFCYVLLLDWRLWRAAIWPAWFYTLRRRITGIIVLCLAVLIWHQ